jgi:hypothetical protein
MPASKKTHARRAAGPGARRPQRGGVRKKTARRSKHFWSDKVTRTSHAMELKQGVFTGNDPAKIASSVLSSARRSHTRKSDPYRSAMSMLNFYINRGGEGLSGAKKKVLERAKASLRSRAGRAKGKAKTTQH